MTPIPLFASLNYARPSSSTEKALSILSNYFYLGGAQASVMEGDNVCLENGEISSSTIAWKVASYVLFFPLTLPLLAISLGLRYQHNFTVISPPKPSQALNPKALQEEPTSHSVASLITQNIGPRVVPPVSQPAVQPFSAFDMIPSVNQGNSHDKLSSLVLNNNLDGIKIFIEQVKEEKGSDWQDSDYIINDACRDAILLGHEGIVKLFLDEGLNADTFAHKPGDSGGICPLKYFAAKIGNLSIVKLLVNKGAKIQDGRHFYNERDNQDAMRAAIEGGHANIVQYLLENGGSAGGVFESAFLNQTFLGRAAFDGQKLLVDLLVKHGARAKSALGLNNEKFRESYNNYNNNALSRYSDDVWAQKRQYLSEEEVKDWNEKKQELYVKRDTLLQNYSNSVQMILDYAMGTNFGKEKTGSFGNYDGLTFLKNLDITGFNFVGLSIDGQPITREILVAQGLKGAAKAIVTCDDILNIEDEERQEALSSRLEAMLEAQGKIISEDGIVNLVPLAEAAKKGHRDVVLIRLSAGVNPNQVTTDVLDSSLAIVAAAKNGFPEIVRLLAEHPEIDKKTRFTAADEAAKKGYLEITEYLNSLMDVNEKDRNGDALIHKAVKAKDVSEIQRLLLLIKKADINLENGSGSTPLLIAASNAGASEKDIELVKFLLANGADPNVYQGDYSPLRAAAKAGSSKAVALLLPVTQKKELKYTVGSGEDQKEICIPWHVPLMFDSYGSPEWLEILSLLKEQGADLNAKNRYEDETILYRVTRNFPSFSKIRMTMEDFKRSIDGCEDRLGSNPLQKDYDHLIEDGKKKFTKALKKLDFLLENGADPQIACSREKNTSLHLLIEKIDLKFIEGATEQVIERFLKYGVDINTPDAYGFTPLHEAARAANLSAVTYLISKGADIKARTTAGQTPLHFAAAGRPQTTKLLIQAGSDVNAIDEDGLSPLAYSRQACKSYMNPSEEGDKPYREAQGELVRAGGK